VIDRVFTRANDPPPGALGHGDFDTVIDVVSQALVPGPYLLGETFTAADLVIGSQLRWGMLFGLVPHRPEFIAYVERLNERPALQRSTRLDEDLAKARLG
jgi:glutathione S-transferase